ncbi:MAG: GNAT family N-acetyltransferase [Bacteroides sp.]|nr:GNAT family N-acetyltransferase [Bacteroides sp.]
MTVLRAGEEPAAQAKEPSARTEKEPSVQTEDATLYITDDGRTAARLLGQGRAVLAYLHEGNRQEDFGGCKFACESVEDLEFAYLDRVYRRYRDIPWDILETGRCLVRETTVEDVDAFYRIYQDPAITRYMESLYEDPAEEYAYARDYIDQVYAFYHFGIWTVVEKSSGEIIGRAGLCYREGFEDPELGFMIAVSRQGQGLATEVCGAILQYGREELGFGRILAFVQPDNLASLRVCHKLGMRDEGEVTADGQKYILLCSDPEE